MQSEPSKKILKHSKTIPILPFIWAHTDSVVYLFSVYLHSLQGVTWWPHGQDPVYDKDGALQQFHRTQKLHSSNLPAFHLLAANQLSAPPARPSPSKLQPWQHSESRGGPLTGSTAPSSCWRKTWKPPIQPTWSRRQRRARETRAERGGHQWERTRSRRGRGEARQRCFHLHPVGGQWGAGAFLQWVLYLSVQRKPGLSEQQLLSLHQLRRASGGGWRSPLSQHPFLYCRGRVRLRFWAVCSLSALRSGLEQHQVDQKTTGRNQQNHQSQIAKTVPGGGGHTEARPTGQSSISMHRRFKTDGMMGSDVLSFFLSRVVARLQSLFFKAQTQKPPTHIHPVLTSSLLWLLNCCMHTTVIIHMNCLTAPGQQVGVDF